MKKNITKYLIPTLLIVFAVAFIALIADDWLAANVDVIGIRISVLIVTFASFAASTIFSLMIYFHNRTVSRLNDDQNRRAELFRDLQFASSNYSIIEFNDRMLITKESTRYIHKYFEKDTPSLHLVSSDLNEEEDIEFYTIRIPIKVVDGKLVGGISLSKITFEKGDQRFDFIPMEHEKIARSYLLYNEKTKRNNLIINIVFNKNSNYFSEQELNEYSKIKIFLKVTSILGVSIEGTSELYFTNPTQVEGDGLHTYKINSSNFRLSKNPYIDCDYVE